MALSATRRRSIGTGVALGLAVTIAAVGLLAFAGPRGGGPGDGLERIETNPGASGERAPGRAFERFDGTLATFDDYAGTPLVVNFWASWCAPCVRELPDFEAVHREVGARVAFLGLNVVNVDTELVDGPAFAARAGVTFDLARDRGAQLLADLQGATMPTTVLIDAQGRVVDRHLGAMTASELRARIEEHFGR